jgi:hypothetical protein
MMTSFRADADAALLDDGVDGADEVLVGAHASGDAVHDDATRWILGVLLIKIKNQVCFR